MQYELTKKQIALIERDLSEMRLQDRIADRNHSPTSGNNNAQLQRNERARIRAQVLAIVRGQRPLNVD